MHKEELRDLLEHLHDKYNRKEFIEPDPISIPHSFSDKADREISGFLAATIAWGNRKAIVKSARRMMQYMDNAPADFVNNASDKDLATLQTYVHRTFNGQDFTDFVLGIRHITTHWGGIGDFFEKNYARYHVPEQGNAGTFYLHPNEAGAKRLAKFWTATIVKAVRESTK